MKQSENNSQSELTMPNPPNKALVLKDIEFSQRNKDALISCCFSKIQLLGSKYFE